MLASVQRRQLTVAACFASSGCVVSTYMMLWKTTCAAGLLIPLTWAQDTAGTPSEPVTTSDPAAPAPSASTATEECSWDGSVSYVRRDMFSGR